MGSVVYVSLYSFFLVRFSMRQIGTHISIVTNILIITPGVLLASGILVPRVKSE